MFIMVQINVQNNQISVLDTKDSSCEVVSLSAVAERIRSRNLKIRGVEPLGGKTFMDTSPIPVFGIQISVHDACIGLAEFYMRKHGMDKISAYRAVGLNV